MKGTFTPLVRLKVPFMLLRAADCAFPPKLEILIGGMNQPGVT
jgi:hypothetical protein